VSFESIDLDSLDDGGDKDDDDDDDVLDVLDELDVLDLDEAPEFAVMFIYSFLMTDFLSSLHSKHFSTVKKLAKRSKNLASISSLLG
jgi:hypothetical protein